jgi:DNA segregation ATPase FtsK/SpoIIIE-like protein
MAKRLVAVTGEYQSKDGQQKAEYTEIGVIITGKNGKDYALIDPAINLAGVLLKQNVLAVKRGEQPSDKVMTSIFEQDNQQGQQQSYQQPQRQQHPQQGYQQRQQRQPAPQGYQPQMGQAPQQQRQAPIPQAAPMDFDDDIPFN